MKNLFILCLAVALCACSNTKVIDNPEVMATNTGAIEISRIELSDTATLFYMNAYSRPKAWIRIAAGTYLIGSPTGKRYNLIRSDGFELDKEVYMPESGNISFKLQFEPIDKKERSLEFIEGDEEGAFILSGILFKKKKPTGKIKTHISGVVIDRPYSSRLALAPWNTDLRVQPWISIPIKDGKFDYTLYSDEKEMYQLIFYDEYSNGMWRPVSFFAEGADINFSLHEMDKYEQITTESDGVLNIEMKNFEERQKSKFSSATMELDSIYDHLYQTNNFYSTEYNDWRKKISDPKTTPEERDKLYRVQEELNSTGRAYTPEGLAINEKLKKLNQDIVAWQFSYIEENVSLFGYFKLTELLYRTKYERTPPDISPYRTLFEEIYRSKYPEHPYTWKIEDFFSGNSLQVGGRYIDFTAPDIAGNDVKLSEQINGKVALIDLWASWCGPCRRKAISMIPVYEKYKERGFTIVGVARESQLSDMVNTIEKDGYPWLNLIELKDKNRIWFKYGVGNGGGAAFLVNREGVILAVDPTAEEVAAILEEVL
jgi:Peroxiredoxin